MTLEEAAQTLRVSTNTLNNWMTQGKIRRVKIGRKTFLERKAVEEFLEIAISVSRS